MENPGLDKNVVTKLKICKYLEEGLSFKDSCISAGITERTGHRWKNEDVSFVSQVEASITKYKEKLIRCVNQGALTNAKIALEVLKIRWPDEWNPVKKVQMFDPQEELEKIRELIYGKENQNGTIRTL